MTIFMLNEKEDITDIPIRKHFVTTKPFIHKIDKIDGMGGNELWAEKYYTIEDLKKRLITLKKDIKTYQDKQVHSLKILLKGNHPATYGHSKMKSVEDIRKFINKIFDYVKQKDTKDGVLGVSGKETVLDYVQFGYVINK